MASPALNMLLPGPDSPHWQADSYPTRSRARSSSAAREQKLAGNLTKDALDEDWRLNKQFVDSESMRYDRLGVSSVADYFELTLSEHADKPALQDVHSGQTWTYSDLDTRSTKAANWLLQQGVRHNTVVALMMPNSLDFVAAWLGLAKLGCVIAAINTSLSGSALIHALAIADVDFFIIDRDYEQSWDAADAIVKESAHNAHSRVAVACKDTDATVARHSSASTARAVTIPRTQHQKCARLQHVRLLWTTSGSGDNSNGPYFCDYSNASTTPVSRSLRAHVTLDDPLFYIYTSGTTGPSKAAFFSHRRFVGAGLTWCRPMRLTAADKYYIVLPLYHGNGGVVAVSACWKAGCCAVIRRKFSSSQFWADVSQFQCTAMIYIGELWQYLLNMPVCPEERNNTLRVIAGNGLRADIWRRVVERFGVERVVEHYGLTEMPAGPYMNCYGRVGACGYIPPHIRQEAGADKLIQFDVALDRCVRKTDGHCVEITKPNEIGEAVFRLEKEYKGYTDPSASQLRMLRNVFEPGDKWFATGDLLKRDEDGFFYFVDRIGDTFRWKGENVSTNEVAQVLQEFPGIKEVNVYGVAYPHRPGRAGMASIVVPSSFGELDLDALYTHIQLLPHFAQPVFLRIRTADNAKTTTLKLQKFAYQKQGFNPDVVTDPVYFRDSRCKQYVRLDNALYEQITHPQFRV